MGKKFFNAYALFSERFDYLITVPSIDNSPELLLNIVNNY